MTLLERLERLRIVDVADYAAIVALVEAAQVTVREFEAENPFVGYSIETLAGVLAAVMEDKP